jgi:hypothetical protein
MEHRNLAAFARWFMSQPPTSWLIPPNPVHMIETQSGTVRGVVLYREGRYQAEFFLITESSKFPEHSHPNVDAIEVMIAGNIEFIIRGRSLFRPGLLEKHPPRLGTKVGVGAGVSHTAILHEGGGAFLSLQRWREGVPMTSVGLDWDGPPHNGVGGAA